MPNIEIFKVKNYSDMSIKAADIISEQLILKPKSVLGLATGSTPLGLYEQLVAKYKNGILDFSGVTSFNLDEYHGLDKTHPQSYYYYMHTNLFDKVNIEKSNVHLPDGMAEDIQEQCKKYDEMIEHNGGIDLQLLGIGHNGHIGFNEPSDKFEKSTWCATLDERTITANTRFFKNAQELPRKSITMGIGTIMRAGKILLIASGEDKREILQSSLFGDITPRVQASILQLHPDVIVVTDCDIRL